MSQGVKHTHFVVFQLRFWSFAIWAAGAHQTRATLTFQLDNNRADVNALRASHDNSTTDLIEVCEGYISGLVKDDGGLHRHAGRPWRRDRRVCAILLHVNELLAMRCCFQLCDVDQKHQASHGCCGLRLRRRFVVGTRKEGLQVWRWRREEAVGRGTSIWAQLTTYDKPIATLGRRSQRRYLG